MVVILWKLHIQLKEGQSWKYYITTVRVQKWLDNIQCTTGNNFLGECLHRGWGNEDCSHSEDAGVECSGIGLL